LLNWLSCYSQSLKAWIIFLFWESSISLYPVVALKKFIVFILPGNSNISFNRSNLENKPCIIQKTSFYDVLKRSLKQLMKQFFMKPSIHDELKSVFCMEYKMNSAFLLRGDDIFLENWFDDHLIVELFLFAYKNNLIISSGPLYDREILEFNRTKFVLGPNFLIIVHFPSLQHSCYASLSNRSLYVCLNPLWATFHGPNHTSYRPNNTCNLQISFWVCAMSSM